MVLNLGYNKFIVPNGLHDKAHLLMSMQAIDTAYEWVEGESVSVSHLAKVEVTVKMEDAPEPLLQTAEEAKELVKAIAQTIKERKLREKAPEGTFPEEESDEG
jgi:hypothetical protein